MGKVWIIGIAGGSASGKSTVVRRLRDYFGDDIGFVSHDSYYKAHDDLTYEERCRLNYDHPDALETDRMVEDLRRLAIRRLDVLGGRVGVEAQNAQRFVSVHDLQPGR